MATTIPLIWRRIAVWSYTRIPQAVTNPKTYQGIQPVRQRQITPQVNDPGFRQFWFQGFQGVDYNIDTIHEAPLNRQNFTVLYDKKMIINPQRGPQSFANSFGELRSRKFWHRGGRIIYDNQERGHDVTSGLETIDGWSVNARNSRGNMYILDIFTDGGSGTSDQAAVAKYWPVGRRYWKEG